MKDDALAGRLKAAVELLEKVAGNRALLAGLSGEERTRLETEALAQAPALQHKLLLGSGTLAQLSHGSPIFAFFRPPTPRNPLIFRTFYPPTPLWADLPPCRLLPGA